MVIIYHCLLYVKIISCYFIHVFRLSRLLSALSMIQYVVERGEDNG